MQPSAADPSASMPLHRQLREWARSEPLLAGLFVAAAVATAAPIWIGRYVPLLDYPNHLSMVFVWRHLHDPQFGFERWYQLNLPPMPYWAQYLTVYALATVFGDEPAMKLFLTLTILLLPVAVAVFARRIGRDPRLALLTFPLSWTLTMAHGFTSYLAGLPMLFFALTALDHHAEKPSLRWGALAAALGASLYFFHVLPWAMFLVIGGFTALISPRPWSLLRAFLAPLPTVPTALIGLWAYKTAHTMSGKTGRYFSGLGGRFEGAYNDIAANLGNIPGWMIDFFPGGSDEAVLFLLFIAWLLILASRPLSVVEGAPQALPATDEGGLRGWRLELGALISAAFYFLLPRSLLRPFYWYAVNRRLAMVMVVFLFLLVRGRIGLRGPRRVLLHVVGVAAIVFGIDVTMHVHRFNVRMKDFDEVMESVPRGKQVLPLMLTLRDPESNISVFNQWGTWVQLRQGGYMPFNLEMEFPIQYRERLPGPVYDQPKTFRFAEHAEAWDYILVYGHEFDPFAGAHDRVRLVKQVREWAMWERLPKPKP